MNQKVAMNIATLSIGLLLVSASSLAAESPAGRERYGGRGLPAMPPTAGDESVVTIDTGILRGAQAGDSYSYLGIPYAAPPVGNLRFRPPAPAGTWSGTRDAVSYSAPCSASEDCLYLNVWRPKGHAQHLPVMLFLHPGGHAMGSGQNSLYGVVGAPYFNSFDGHYLAEHGKAVVVTINYRYGNLGFAAHPSLTAEDPNHSSGNYGILDQIAALEWTQRNIAAFGGNRHRVTLMGQSVGAMDTCTHLVSPLSRGLFSQALLSSEPGCVRPTLAYQEAFVGTKLVTNAGCAGSADIPACLRSKPEGVIRGAFVKPFDPAWRIGGNVDGYVLKGQPEELIAKRRGADVPTVLGGTLDEYASLIDNMIPQAGPIDTGADYVTHITKWFGPYGSDVVTKVLAKFPSGTYGTPRQTLIRVMSDAFFTAVQRRLGRHLDASQGAPVRRYVTIHSLENAPLNALAAAHGVDLPFIFHNLNLSGPAGAYSPTANEVALADLTSRYFQRYFAAGNPNEGEDANDHTAKWPKLHGEHDWHLEIGSTVVSAQKGFRTAECDFWDAIVPRPFFYNLTP
jgi:para-nitrobenzyl esterase